MFSSDVSAIADQIPAGTQTAVSAPHAVSGWGLAGAHLAHADRLDETTEASIPAHPSAKPAANGERL
jgi:hypothetical protein